MLFRRLVHPFGNSMDSIYKFALSTTFDAKYLVLRCKLEALLPACMTLERSNHGEGDYH